MNGVKQYIDTNKERFLDELFDLIRIPSISSESAHKEDMVRCANKWKEYLLAAGADKAEVMPSNGNPVVYGEKIIDTNKPTVMVYGHYDVMPVAPIELWNTNPFDPIVKDGHIWARGADDDKGQSFMHAKAFELMVKTGQLPCNVKFMIEGEEEIGSTNLYAFCEQHKDLLQCDVILVSDTGMIAQDIPSITSGLRGLYYWEVDVKSANRDLHSGIYGGAVANPINVLCKMIADMHDENGHITIPGFYDDVLVISDEERALMGQAPFDEAQYKASLDIKEVHGEKGYTTNERTGIRPCLDVCGIWGGYINEGSKTVLPAEAHAKISVRLVANQDYEKIGRQFQQYFESVAPSYVTVSVTPCHGGAAYVCPINTPGYKAAEQAMTTTFGKRPLPTRSGGSIGIIAGFERILGVKSILMGFGLGSDAIHAPNENYPLFNFYKGIETIPYFYENFAQLYNKQ
ncbi:MAG: dipeptidase [Bacteroidales bacterium]|nr:dipeptidase [Candidatus Colimorpha onthohippi]